jgi:hypothetical protein
MFWSVKVEVLMLSIALQNVTALVSCEKFSSQAVVFSKFSIKGNRLYSLFNVFS